MYSSKKVVCGCIIAILNLSIVSSTCFAMDTTSGATKPNEPSSMMHDLEVKIEELKKELKKLQHELEERRQKAAQKKEAKAAEKRAKQDAQIRAREIQKSNTGQQNQ